MKKLSSRIQIFYGLGVSYAIVDQIFAQWVLYYYLPPENSGIRPLMAPLFYITGTGFLEICRYDHGPASGSLVG